VSAAAGSWEGSGNSHVAGFMYLPSADSLSLSLSMRTSSSLDMPKSSSESMVSGVGGDVTTAAEAILLLVLFAGFEDGSASAAFLFLVWEEIVSAVEVCLKSSGGDDIQGTQGCDSLV
jgi:hypothetical protein